MRGVPTIGVMKFPPLGTVQILRACARMNPFTGLFIGPLNGAASFRCNSLLLPSGTIVTVSSLYAVTRPQAGKSITVCMMLLWCEEYSACKRPREGSVIRRLRFNDRAFDRTHETRKPSGTRDELSRGALIADATVFQNI